MSLNNQELTARPRDERSRRTRRGRRARAPSGASARPAARRAAASAPVWSNAARSVRLVRRGSPQKRDLHGVWGHGPRLSTAYCRAASRLQMQPQDVAGGPAVAPPRRPLWPCCARHDRREVRVGADALLLLGEERLRVRVGRHLRARGAGGERSPVHGERRARQGVRRRGGHGESSVGRPCVHAPARGAVAPPRPPPGR